jgi:hypothetical protein
VPQTYTASPPSRLAATPHPSSPTGSAGYPVERSLLQADGLALSLRSALDRIAVPLARAAEAFVRQKAWFQFGFARLDDHARERFGRSGRWLRDLATLGGALTSLPALAEALTGEDGGSALGRVAATLIGRAATPDSLPEWVALARSVSVRELRDAIRRARSADVPSADPRAANACSADSHVAPEPDDASAPDYAPAPDDAPDRSLVRFLVPAPVRAAFDEAVDLYRAVEGGEATVTSFVEALVAEALTGPHPPDADCAPMKRGPDASLVETALARSTENWRHLPATSEASWALALAGVGLARFETLARQAGTGGPADLDGQLRALLALEDDLQARLGRLLAEMGERGAWARLRFADVGHYAEQRLGLSRTAAEDRARAARDLRRLPLLRRAYESGRVGLEVTRLVARILGPGPVDAPTERAWVDRAEEATVKRLRDEARALGRYSVRAAPARPTTHAEPLAARPAAAPPAPAQPAAALEADPAADASHQPARRSGRPLPPDDAAWHDSLRRAPGTARERVLLYGLIAADALDPAALAGSPLDRTSPLDPDVFLRLRLPDDLATSLLAAVESSRRALSRQADSVPWDEPWPDTGAGSSPSVLAARMFSIRARRVPAWVGLLALIEGFVLTWDTDEQGPRRPRDRDAVYIRDGWRCTAPGCTSRRNLEDHHLTYRSRGGGDQLSNRTCLCRFHHQRGEHGDLASCRGEAPLGITWRLGRAAAATWYRNERRLRDGRPLDEQLRDGRLGDGDLRRE